jgi:hypothetical protein
VCVCVCFRYLKIKNNDKIFKFYKMKVINSYFKLIYKLKVRTRKREREREKGKKEREREREIFTKYVF